MYRPKGTGANRPAPAKASEVWPATRSAPSHNKTPAFAKATAGTLRLKTARRVEAGGFAPPSEDVRPKACYVA